MTSDPDLEKALIARLLYDPESLPLLTIQADDFSVPQWASVFEAMTRLTSEHRVVDVTSLRGLCPDVDFRGLLDEISPAHRASVVEYAESIRDMAFRRRLRDQLALVSKRLEIGSTEDALAALSEAVQKAVAGVGAARLLSPDQAIAYYGRVIDERINHRVGLRWSPDALNTVIQPAQGGELCVVAARPSVGKTLIAEQTTEVWAQESGKPVLFASLEMSVAKLLDRAMIRRGHVARGVLTANDAVRIKEALSTRKGVGVWYLDNPRATTTDLRAAAAKVKMLGNGLGGIAIDYIGLLRDRGDNEVQRIGRITAELKALAREHEVPVLALSQLNRNSMYREDKIPRLEDLRDSGSTEQDADIVLGLHREIGEGTMTLKVLKNRDGAAGHTIDLWFDEQSVSLT